jgi:hypothetical protein
MVWRSSELRTPGRVSNPSSATWRGTGPPIGVERVTTLEQHEGAGLELEDGRRCVGVAGETAGDDVVPLVVGRAGERRALELTADLGALERDGHHEVGLVEVPREFVAVVHRGDVQGAERIGVPVQHLAVERAPDELEEHIPLVQRAQR